MGQKIHPVGFRLPVTRNWASRWYASNQNFATMLAEDLKVREFLKARLKSAAVSRILIERPAKNAGITIMSSGRLNGIEIARCEWYREGRVPLHTLKADIDYGFSEAKTTYGVIGVKCWVYRGDRLAHGEAPGVQTPMPEEERRPRRPARPGAPGERRGPAGVGRGGDRDRGAPRQVAAAAVVEGEIGRASCRE